MKTRLDLCGCTSYDGISTFFQFYFDLQIYIFNFKDSGLKITVWGRFLSRKERGLKKDYKIGVIFFIFHNRGGDVYV